jgi:hypothetical protein
MDEKSTPIESLHNQSDDSEVVNQILNKYNTLQNPPLQQQTELETNFENRNLNNEMYNINMDNSNVKQHYQKEMSRLKKTQQYEDGDEDDQNEDENEYEEEYEEYEVVENPLWKRVANDLRIPIIIFFLILFFFNPAFDKFLISKFSYFGNQYNECNTYGFLLKALIVSLLSYILIKYIKL